MAKTIENILEENIVKKYLHNKNVDIDVMNSCTIFIFKIDENITIKELLEFEEKIIREMSFYYFVDVKYSLDYNGTLIFECDKENFKESSIYCVEDEIIFYTEAEYIKFCHETDCEYGLFEP